MTAALNSILAFSNALGLGHITPSVDIQSILQKQRTDFKVPAVAAAVIRSEGIVASGMVGVRKNKSAGSVTIDDRWHLGSCTKAMTATLCGRLVDQGRLRWNMTVAEALGPLSEKLHERFQRVKLEQLLCHRAGLPEDRLPSLLTWPRILALQGRLPVQREGLVEIVMSGKPAHSPGETYAYSNFGFVVAAAMAESVTGKSYESLMRQQVFDPLGIQSAGFGPPGDSARIDQPWGHQPGLLGYQPMPPGPAADNPAVVSPSGRVHMSVADWAKFAREHLRSMRARPAPLLKSETWAYLHSDPFEQDYAFGWAHREWPRVRGRVFVHDGSNRLWYALIVILPEMDLAILAVTNAGGDEAEKACNESIRALFALFETASSQPASRPSP